MAQVVVLTLFGLWLLLSVLVYIPAARRVIRSLDWFMLVPTWKFFAPTPGQHDFHVLYQDRYAVGTLTQWTEVHPVARRKWFGILWNPGKRANKALFDIVQEFAIAVNSEEQGLELTVPYLSLLNYVSSVPRSTSPEFTTFLLMRSQGNALEDDPKVVFVSRFHGL